jgi:osmoprotectant transport system ATP-binding protein
VLLMDEPFSALDPVTRLRLQGELLRVQSLVRKTIVVVTHDIDEALRLGDRVILLQTGGRLAQVATPAELLAHPASDFVAGFLGGDRTLRRLALVPLGDAELRPLDGAVPAERVGAGGSLRDGLEVVLRSPDGRAAVVDGDRVLGVIDAEVIRRAAAPR